MDINRKPVVAVLRWLMRDAAVVPESRVELPAGMLPARWRPLLVRTFARE